MTVSSKKTRRPRAYAFNNSAVYSHGAMIPFYRRNPDEIPHHLANNMAMMLEEKHLINSRRRRSKSKERRATRRLGVRPSRLNPVFRNAEKNLLSLHKGR